MKNNFWIGLVIGCISNLLALALFSTVTAQVNQPNPGVTTQTVSGSSITLAVPTGGEGSGPVSTTITYQGLLKKNNVPFTGNCDMQFKLYDAQSAGTLLSTAAPVPSPVAANNGLFTVNIDFGDQFQGDYRYLEPLVSCPASGAPSYQSLGLQVIYATPYALSLRPGATISGTLSPMLQIHGNNAGGNALVVDNMSSNNYSTAIYGDSWTGRAVVGYSLAFTGTGVGVWGIANSPTGVGVAAQGGSTGTGAALALYGGNIRVSYAGIGTNTPVFIHQVKTGTGNNICNIQAYSTVINNTLINGNPNAILIVTPNYGPDDGTGTAPAVGIPAVYYDATNQCGKGAGKWVIYNLNATALTNNSLYNVMAIVP